MADTAHYRWRVVLPDGTAFELCSLPETTAAKMCALYTGAIIEPLPDDPRESEPGLPRG